MRFLVLIAALFLLFGCQSEDSISDEKNNASQQQDKTNNNTTQSEEQKNNDDTFKENKENYLDLSKFFKPDQTVAHFKGTGNEYASYTEKTTWLNDEYVGTIIDNGGVTKMTVYKISDEKIDILYDEAVDENTEFPPISDLEKMNPIETYLANPIQVRATFGNWRVIGVNMPLNTPYQTFHNAIVIEERGDKYINRKYFAEGFGEIRTESTSEADDGAFYTVTSTLESIE